jgi:transitional endoplasmic reticulum ATPase
MKKVSPKTLARVDWVNPTRSRWYISFRDGRSADCEGVLPAGIDLGSAVLVDLETGQTEAAPPELFPAPKQIGVVRLVTDTELVLDVGGRWISAPKPANTAVERGYSVEISSLNGLIRTLSTSPLKMVDLETVDAQVVESFKVKKDSMKESFQDFGGFSDIVEKARQLIAQLGVSREDLATVGVRPIRGVLFTGPPGTGKTMLARIIAREINAAFFEVAGPTILSKWYGESELLLRRIFEAAEKEDGAIIFFDEIDSLAGKRSQTLHEASVKLVAQMLALLDGFSRRGRTLVIGTTNRPEAIDPALRRPGRFDWEIRFRLPTSAERLEILTKQGRTTKTYGDIDLEGIANQAEGWNAAELSLIWAEAGMLALSDGRKAVGLEDILGGFRAVRDMRRDRKLAGGM